MCNVGVSATGMTKKLSEKSVVQTVTHVIIFGVQGKRSDTSLFLFENANCCLQCLNPCRGISHETHGF